MPKKVLAPLESRRKRMSRLELVCGNWLLKQKWFEDHEPEEAYSKGIELADQIRRFFKIEEGK